MLNSVIHKVHRVSNLFQPMQIIPKDQKVKNNSLAKSYRLMLNLGIIQQANPGMYVLLPLGSRVLEKLITIIDNAMSRIGAQKISLPSLTNSKLWEETGRLETMKSELFTLKDRYQTSYVLGPTYEEVITNLISTIGSISKHQLPLLLYQISNKWRDEKKSRLGLFRSREFVMKDLYSFDLTYDDAQQTYKSIQGAYKNIFNHIGIPYTVADGNTGLMGGTVSHEYQYISSIGEDIILSCNSCGIHKNSVLVDKPICENCHQELTKNSAIEVGHTFLLGTKYSKVFNATCHTNNSQIPMVMGSYGIGLTRIISAAAEILSTDDCLRWPESIAPYTLYVIPPKENSRESSATHLAEKIIEVLYETNIDFLVDDRTALTIGRRMINAKCVGYPYVIVIGKAAMQSNPLYELHDINNSQQFEMSFDELVDFVKSTKQKEKERALG